ncbi:hypothetical protein K502DRAFT_353710 [Neoconidiobolus thromboides FSU 785]|nr:hypothetical protein K502DRAFT_353710 [Neoconidiobolus thromboides FSU 785]
MTKTEEIEVKKENVTDKESCLGCRISGFLTFTLLGSYLLYESHNTKNLENTKPTYLFNEKWDKKFKLKPKQLTPGHFKFMRASGLAFIALGVFRLNY